MKQVTLENFQKLLPFEVQLLIGVLLNRGHVVYYSQSGFFKTTHKIKVDEIVYNSLKDFKENFVNI